MAETVTIARPYAEAAFKLAKEQNQLERWSQMLELLEACYRAGRGCVANCIGDPKVTGRSSSKA